MRFVTHPEKQDHPGAEAHVMEAEKFETLDARTYSMTAPEATEETPVVDCEFRGRLMLPLQQCCCCRRRRRC